MRDLRENPDIPSNVGSILHRNRKMSLLRDIKTPAHDTMLL